MVQISVKRFLKYRTSNRLNVRFTLDHDILSMLFVFNVATVSLLFNRLISTVKTYRYAFHFRFTQFGRS